MKICTECNIEKFETDFYKDYRSKTRRLESKCKECRNKLVRDYNKEKKLVETEEKNKEIDPSSNIRSLIIETILNVPIIDGKSVEEKIKNSEDDISEVLCTNVNDLQKLKEQFFKEICNLNNKIKELENEVHLLKNQIPS
jgi:hypothetical protein